MNGVDERHAVAVEITVEGETAKPGIDEHLALLALLQFPHLRRGAAIGLFGKEVSAGGGILLDRIGLSRGVADELEGKSRDGHAEGIVRIERLKGKESALVGGIGHNGRTVGSDAEGLILIGGIEQAVGIVHAVDAGDAEDLVGIGGVCRPLHGVSHAGRHVESKAGLGIDEHEAAAAPCSVERPLLAGIAVGGSGIKDLRVLSGGSAIGEGFARGAVDDAVEPTRLRRVGSEGGKCSGEAEAQGKQGGEKFAGEGGFCHGISLFGLFFYRLCISLSFL